MIALILKELRCYAHQPKYRRIQFVVVCLLALTLFAAAIELFAMSRAHPQVHVGRGIYSILVPTLFIAMLCLAVPFLSIEAFQSEQQNSNWDLLNMAPIGSWKILFAKLIGAMIATLWCIWLAVPLFWLSAYTGGFALRQLLQCSLVFIAGFTLFFLIGNCFTLFGSSMRAISRSYAVVLLITFAPLLISHTMVPLLALPALLLDLLRMLSPLCVLISIIKSKTQVAMGIAPIWLWMSGGYMILSALLFWILNRLVAKRDLSNISLTN
jgi:ABC-type transport system involved in multi-copper enzyme maturation permease subunit